MERSGFDPNQNQGGAKMAEKFKKELGTSCFGKLNVLSLLLWVQLRIRPEVSLGSGSGFEFESVFDLRFKSGSGSSPKLPKI
jgi:hypothetical protein